jgi:hypothetical protein
MLAMCFDEEFDRLFVVHPESDDRFCLADFIRDLSELLKVYMAPAVAKVSSSSFASKIILEHFNQLMLFASSSFAQLADCFHISHQSDLLTEYLKLIHSCDWNSCMLQTQIVSIYGQACSCAYHD